MSYTCNRYFNKNLKSALAKAFSFCKKSTLITFTLLVYLFPNVYVLVGISEIFNYSLNQVYALTESTHSFPTDTNFNANGYDDGGSAATVSSSQITLSKADNWWNVAYKYHKQLTIKNLSGDDLAASATMQYKVNTKALYDAGQLQADCDDLRIVYYTGSGDPAEVTRSTHVSGGFTNCSDSTNTTVAFPLQAGLTNGSSTTDYYLYYGNADATNPGYGDNGYSIGNAEATLVCPFDGTTTCVDGETPSTSTGAIRYSTKGALSFDGKDDRVEVSRSAISSALSTALTFETWFKTPDKTKSGHIFGGTNFGSDFHSLIYNYGHSASQYFTFIVRTGAGDTGVNVLTNTGGTINNNQWYHIAGTYDGSIVKIYIDGVLSGQAALTGNSSTGGPPSLGIGANYCGTDTYPNCVNYLAGYLDEVRISNSVRYTENFTPQTTPFEPDANTKLLLHFDENGDDPRNTGKAIDSSGNGNHGTITGAKYVGGLVGVDASSSDSGNVGLSSYGSHNGIFIEEGTTNKITNPSFENATAYNTNWGSNYFNYDSSADTFTASMAKRNSAGPFAAGVMVQGPYGGSNDSGDDGISWSKGNQISGNFYQQWDGSQGTIVFWITPEWNGNDNLQHRILTGGYPLISKSSTNKLVFDTIDSGSEAELDISSWVAGSTYQVTIRWDSTNTLDGTNYISMSVNDSHSFSRSSAITIPSGIVGIGDSGSWSPTTDAIIEGLTIYRRPLFDGTYGIDVGNGDEINQIYNSGTGKDPTLVTGSWDVVFALPTNASTGALTTGTGNAWSHPHASNLLYTSTTNTGGFMMNGTYTTDGFATVGSPSSVGALATSEKIFSGGYKFTSTGASQGIYRTFTATSGGDYVIRAIGHSDGTCDPQVKITRADGTTEISHLDGTTTSTRTDPDVYLFTWEAPAAEANQIQLINTASSGTCYWHQVEVLVNGIGNPSMETGSGDPWIPTGWDTWSISSGDTQQESTVVHSGSSSVRFNSSMTSGEFINRNMFGGFAIPVGRFVSIGAFVYGNGTTSPRLSSVSDPLVMQSTTNTSISLTGSAPQWILLNAVGRSIATNSWDRFFLYGNSAGPIYADDAYSVALTDVSLTVTPASEANSTESTGLRVDGYDTLTQPITGLSADRGVIKFKFTPRHNYADAGKFGYTPSAPSYQYPSMLYSNANGANWISVFMETTSSLLIRFVFNNTAVDARWSNPTLNAGTTYNIEFSYETGGNLVMKVDGTQVASASMGSNEFSAIPTTMYFGNSSNNGRAYDATISNFTALTPTANTTAPYYKFGSKSAKLVNSGSYADEYTTAINPASTATHTLSAYVYDGTSGNVGGTVSSSIAKLVFGGTVVTPSSYTDMGGGWWRLSYSAATASASRLYGVQVLAGKTLYVDGVQLEAKSYATTYADGSLGTGYSWSGTANDSTGVRTTENLEYSQTSNIDASNGAISFWFQPKKSKAQYSSSAFTMGLWSWTSGSYKYDIRYFDNTGSGGSTCNFQFNRSVGSNLTASGPLCITFTKDAWYHVVANWSSSAGSSIYVNNTTGTSHSNTTMMSNGGTMSFVGNHNSFLSHNGNISDVKIFNSALTAEQVTDLYYTGLQTHQSGSEVDDRYGTGTYTSPVVDLSANGAWGSTPFTATETLNSGTISYSTRTSADNSTWSDWASVSGSTIASTALRYLQWKADLAPASSPVGGAPTITGAQIAYVEDSTAPVNPDTTASGFSTSAVQSADLTSATWYNYATPKFSWTAGTDPAASGQSASGVASYHALLTTNNSAVPADNTGDDCYALISAGAESYTVGTSNANCSLSNGVYYLRLQTKDNSGNVADPVTLFTYQFDSSIPNAPSNVATGNVGYQSTNSYTFFWPTATDNGPAGVVGYEYKTGASSGDYSDWQFTANTEVTGVPAYQEGQNFFYVRTKDNAGNYSGSTSNDIQIASFYYNETAPNAPTNLSISPSTSSSSPSDSNVFTVTWDKPSSYSGDISKYYYCVNCTPSRENMTETTPTQTVNETITSAALATQQGKNTLYIVAEDNNVNSTTGRGNANFEAYASVDFYATTTAPGKPTNLTVSDVSDRAEEKWRLSLAWDAPTTGGTPAHYKVYRSTDNKDFTLIGQTTSPAYTDSGLTQSKIYYYKAYAIDNAGSSSLATSTVSLAPEGKYDDPPSNGGTPTVTEGSTTATITWTSNRISYGTVEYGKTSSLGSSANESTPTVDHSIKLTGLTPGVVYYYRVQALDEGNLVGYERTDAYSSVYSFTTLSQSNISDVTVTDLGLDTAVVSWKTSSLSTSQVDYGTSTEYGESLSVSTTASESLHSARLTGLKHSTKYHFRIKGTTVDDTDISSEDYTFETITLPKVTAVVFKTNQEEGGTAAVLGFSTNVPTTAQVEYQAVDLDTNELDLNMLNKIASYMPEDEADNLKPDNINLAKAKGMDQTVLASLPVIPKGDTQTIYDGQIQDRHLLKAKGLQDGAIYIFTIKGFDKYGNETSSDPIRYITGADTVPPTIRNLKIETPIVGSGNSSAGQIIVSFETDEASRGKVLWGYGTGTEYSSEIASNSGYIDKHVVIIRDLDLTSTYHIKVVAEDMANNVSESGDNVVVTPTPAQAAFDVVLENLEDIFGFLNL